MEPINDSTVDKSWELLGSVSECITDWGEAKGHVKISLNSINEELPAVVFAIK
jgi:hypothetical protein